MFFRKSLILPLAMASLTAGAQTKDLAITDAKVETGTGVILPKVTILIQGGKIVSVGETVNLPAGIQTISGAGKVVYPGFIDAYTTNGLKLPDTPAAGSAPDSRSTAPATMWHGNRKGIRTDIVASKCLAISDQLKDNYSQGITTAVLSSGNGTVRGNATIIDYLGTGSVLVPTFATELSFRNGSGSGYPGTLFGVVATLRQTLADAQFYARQTNPAKDTGLENLRSLVTHKVPALFVANSAREIVRANRIAEEFGLKWLDTGGSEAYRDIGLLKKNGIPVIVYIDPGFEPSRKMDTGISATPQAVLDERYQTWVEHTENVKKLEEAKIPYAFSTGGNSLSDFLKNIRKIVSSGVPRTSALEAMTSHAAELLGVRDRTGTIEPGKLANLVLMNGDFENDKSVVLSVIVEGSLVEVAKGGSK